MRPILYILCLLCCTQLWGQEEILQYSVAIEMGNLNEIEVTETIKIRAEGHEVKRGIYRTFPTTRPNADNIKEPTPVHIQSIKRDGKKEKYHTEKSGDDLRLYIGDKDVTLSPGIYTYDIQYTAVNPISFFESYDELYWNVIGQFWNFPIKSYSATIQLPPGANYVQGACYTGSYGDRASQCELTLNTDSTMVNLKGIGELTPYQGATIAIAWSKGFITDHFNQQAQFGLKDIIVFVASLCLFGFIGFRWWLKVGKDAAKKAIVPQWNPPDNLSPAAMGYILKHHISSPLITASIVNAAVKGRIKIENEKKKFTFTSLDENADLTAEERALIDSIFAGRTEYKLTKKTFSTYQTALSSFSWKLKNKIKLSQYYKYNLKHAFLACVLLAFLVSLTFTIGSSLRVSNRLSAFFFCFLFTLIIYIVISVPCFLRKWYRWLIILPLTGLSAVVFPSYVSSVPFFITNTWPVFILYGISCILLIIYQVLIVAPTALGQKVTSEIKGFKLYLEKAEKSLLEHFTPPEKTPELFEKYLPYAIALGVENKWADKFEAVLAQAIANNEYHPVWYSGQFHQIHQISQQFSSAVSSAAPKSSSGSSGGGFSGGGGGGGGGGGW